jgi:hypothetical protein
MDKNTPTTNIEEKVDPSLSSLDVANGTAVDVSTANTIFIEPEKERAVIKKFDKYLLPQAFLFILLNYLDRSNLGNARVFGFDDDIGLKGNEFGNMVTLFFVPYIIFEVFCMLNPPITVPGNC